MLVIDAKDNYLYVQYLVKQKLTSSIILALFGVLCEEAADDNPLGILMADHPDNSGNCTTLVIPCTDGMMPTTPTTVVTSPLMLLMLNHCMI